MRNKISIAIVLALGIGAVALAANENPTFLGRLVRLSRLATGSIPAASAENEGSLVWDDTTNEVKVSNGASFSPVGAVSGSGANGAVTFWTGASSLGADSTNLFWDDTTNRLGLGTASPQKQLHLSTGEIRQSGIDWSYNTIDSASTVIQANTTTGTAWKFFPPTGNPNSSLEFYETTDLTLTNHNRLLINTNYPFTNSINFATQNKGTGTIRPMVWSTGTEGGAHTERMRLTSAGVFSVDTNVLYVDPATNRVGVNDSTPSFSLDVTGTAQITGAVTLGTPLPLTGGGTNKSMTTVNGGVVYTDADSQEVSAAGTLGQCLKSGGAGAPTWSACSIGSPEDFGAFTDINAEEQTIAAHRVVNTGTGVVLLFTVTTLGVAGGGNAVLTAVDNATERCQITIACNTAVGMVSTAACAQTFTAGTNASFKWDADSDCVTFPQGNIDLSWTP